MTHVNYDRNKCFCFVFLTQWSSRLSLIKRRLLCVTFQKPVDQNITADILILRFSRRPRSQKWNVVTLRFAYDHNFMLFFWFIWGTLDRVFESLCANRQALLVLLSSLSLLHTLMHAHVASKLNWYKPEHALAFKLYAVFICKPPVRLVDAERECDRKSTWSN